MVTRDRILQQFAENGSVLLGGKIITRVEDLPSDLELAAGDTDRQAAILAQMGADLAKQQAEFEALKAQLEPAKPTGKSGNPKTEPPPPDANAELRARLEDLTIAELRAEAKAEGITIPALVNTKDELVNFLITQA